MLFNNKPQKYNKNTVAVCLIADACHKPLRCVLANIDAVSKAKTYNGMFESKKFVRTYSGRAYNFRNLAADGHIESISTLREFIGAAEYNKLNQFLTKDELIELEAGLLN